MRKSVNVSASEFDGVQYRKAKTWQIALSQFNNASAMVFYTLVGLMSYVGNEGYGIVMASIGVILTVTRVFDGLIDPFLALMIDKVNTKFGKLRLFMSIGWVIRSIAMYMLFIWGSGRGFGVVYFIILYSIYIVGSSIFDIAGNMISSVLTNDPRQRPMIQVWSTAYSYLIPTILTLVTTIVLLPRFGNQYSTEMLSSAALIFIPVSLVMMLLCFVGVAEVDKPENFIGTATTSDENNVSMRDMMVLFKRNKPFQMYIISSVAAKLGQQTAGQAIITTMLFGILIGNIQLGSIMGAISILPAIVFSIVGAKYSGKFGNKATVVTWTVISIVISVLSVIYLAIIDTRLISQSRGYMIVFFALLILVNGAKMCVTVANGAMRADIIDYELDASGKFVPAVITATYNFIDQFITSLGSTIAAIGVSLIGYATVAPQPTDELNPSIKWMTLFLYYGVPVLGWLVGLVAMKYYKLSKEEMVEVQRRIADKKEAILEQEGADS